MITAGRAREHSNHHDEDSLHCDLPFIDRHNVDSLRTYGFANTRSFSYRSAAPGGCMVTAGRGGNTINTMRTRLIVLLSTSTSTEQTASERMDFLTHGASVIEVQRRGLHDYGWPGSRTTIK